jgi:hypothetical protein
LLTDVQVPPLAPHIRRTSASTADRVGGPISTPKAVVSNHESGRKRKGEAANSDTTLQQYERLGDHDEALDFLEKIVPRSTAYQRSWFDNEPDLDPIRNHPRFRKILAALAPQDG